MLSRFYLISLWILFWTSPDLCFRMAGSTEAALLALAEDDPAAFTLAMEGDLAGRLALPLVDASTGPRSTCFAYCCSLQYRRRRKWGFVSLQFAYTIHLAILLQSVRIFELLLADNAEHLAQLESDGSTVLHSLARCQMFAPSFKRAKYFETTILTTLCDHPALLRRLVQQEDSAGLRPLESCVKFAAFRLARKLLHLPGYLLSSVTRSGGWTVRLYDLTDYDLHHGTRCQVSPLHLLTYVAPDQVDSLKKSKLLGDPLIKQWIRLCLKQTRVLTIVRILVLSVPTVIFLLTGINESVMTLVSSIGNLVHCNKATFTAAALKGYNSTALNDTSLYYEFFNSQIVKHQTCEQIFSSVGLNILMIALVLMFQFLVALFKLLFRACDRRQRLLMFPDPHRTECFVRRGIFDAYLGIALAAGFGFFAVSSSLFKGETFYHYLPPMSSSNSSFLYQEMFVGSNTLFISFTLLHFAQYMEIVTKSTGKLFYIFHSMLSSFLAALPLLFYWIMLFSLDFYILVNSPDFELGILSLYSSIKTIMNMITYSLDSPIVLIIHVLFFFFVGLNLLNFLIAFVNETFQQCNSDFEVAFSLLRLLAAFNTHRYFRPVFSVRHWLESRPTGECKRRILVEVMQPKFKRMRAKIPDPAE